MSNEQTYTVCPPVYLSLIADCCLLIAKAKPPTWHLLQTGGSLYSGLANRDYRLAMSE
jgi:hypothetical protein